MYSRLKNARDKYVKTLSTFVNKFFNCHREKKKSSIVRMKTVASERCNAHTLYRLPKGIIPKIINNI